MAAWPKKHFYHILATSRRSVMRNGGASGGFGEPALWHAFVIIFLEFFSWGLLTIPLINVLAVTFPTNKFLMNGFFLGVKGLLPFLSALLIGALSDIWGRKFLLILTVFSTCVPIPLLTFSPLWHFVLFSISGLFSATYSVVLAYVADITDKEKRNAAYGLVSATFGASLVTSPALGAFLSQTLNNEVVVALATAIACLDVFFIMVAVPESLPAKLRHSWDRVTWESADPFATLRKVGEDFTVMLLCAVVFLSYLPEAGQFSCFFVYLKLVVGFRPASVAAYIGVVGVMSVVAQTAVLMPLHKTFGCKKTILFGLLSQAAQLFWYGFGSQYWMMWAAGALAALSQITYPSVSSYLSVHSDGDKQGTVQGIVTGIRGLCQGLGPALFGFIFYLFDMDLNSQDEPIRGGAFAPRRFQPGSKTTPLYFPRHRPPAVENVPHSLMQNLTTAAFHVSSSSRWSESSDSNALWAAYQRQERRERAYSFNGARRYRATASPSGNFLIAACDPSYDEDDDDFNENKVDDFYIDECGASSAASTIHTMDNGATVLASSLLMSRADCTAFGGTDSNEDTIINLEDNSGRARRAVLYNSDRTLALSGVQQ